MVHTFAAGWCLHDPAHYGIHGEPDQVHPMVALQRLHGVPAQRDNPGRQPQQGVRRRDDDAALRLASGTLRNSKTSGHDVHLKIYSITDDHSYISCSRNIFSMIVISDLSLHHLPTHCCHHTELTWYNRFRALGAKTQERIRPARQDPLQ